MARLRKLTSPTTYNKMLNQRQELFCINYVSGMSGTESAIKAGYEPASATVTASRMLRYDNITERIALLNAPAVMRVQSTKDAKLQVLEEIYTHKPDSETITGMVVTRAIAEHNKMEGDYAPEKHAVLGDIEITIIHKDKGE